MAAISILCECVCISQDESKADMNRVSLLYRMRLAWFIKKWNLPYDGHSALIISPSV